MKNTTERAHINHRGEFSFFFFIFYSWRFIVLTFTNIHTPDFCFFSNLFFFYCIFIISQIFRLKKNIILNFCLFISFAKQPFSFEVICFLFKFFNALANNFHVKMIFFLMRHTQDTRGQMEKRKIKFDTIYTGQKIGN